MSTGPKRVLFIDDRPGGPTPEEKSLSAAGYTIIRSRPGPRTAQAAVQASPDLIILQYTYGDQLSAYICNLLTRKEELASKPIILLSAKPELVRQLHRDVKSIVDVIGQPFAEQSLVAAADRALRREPPGIAPAGGPASQLDDEILRLTGGRTPGADDPDALASRKISRAIGRWIAGKIREGYQEASGSGPEPTALSIARKALDPASLEMLTSELSSLSWGAPLQGICGSGRYIEFSDLLQSLGSTRATGILSVSGAGNRVELSLLSGAICFLNPRAIRLRFCLESLSCSHLFFPMAYIEEVLKKGACPDDSPLFHMLQDGKVHREQFKELMLSLSLEVLRECILEQESSQFEFRPLQELQKRFLEHDLGLPVQRFILRLMSHLDEWKAVQKETQNRKVRFAAESRAAEADLLASSDDQVTLLAVQEAPRTIDELCPICQLSPFQVWRCLARLQKEGLVRMLEDKTDPASAPAPAQEAAAPAQEAATR